MKLVSLLTQDKLCLPHHILEERGLVTVGVTVQALLDLPASRSAHPLSVWLQWRLYGCPAVLQLISVPQSELFCQGLETPLLLLFLLFLLFLGVRPQWLVASVWLKQETWRWGASLHDVRPKQFTLHHIFTQVVYLVAGNNVSPPPPQFVFDSWAEQLTWQTWRRVYKKTYASNSLPAATNNSKWPHVHGVPRNWVNRDRTHFFTEAASKRGRS